ncbi:GNAT family N-acetyltransferase [Hymenobacter busanensis]|uniref:GNAT family N-acetyltransferase n=1 Tax=Hymenobacter busanensis TaxID=2607656 RepID=A0A7L4ZY34_9BACT|nr:GNAT family N-acetyltransferase [Hymenobacter busanensis]KAA9333144.1 GNAT family N-acetyltransferase [Hymenobacter busanensis]QHJ08181.1 GNAT family N-acetyltransferase [Hymenobacter busanensis]
MPQPITYRELTPADAAAFRTLRLQALHASPEAFGSTLEEELTSVDRRFAQQFSGPGRCITGAFDGEQLIGMMGFVRETRHKTQHRGSIWGVFVAPEYRGLGIGTGLFQHLLHRLDALDGLEQIELVVSEQSPAARRLYERAGFVEFGRLPGAFSSPDDGPPVSVVYMVRRRQEPGGA